MKTKDLIKDKTYAHCSDRDMREYNTRKVVVVDPVREYGVSPRFSAPDAIAKKGETTYLNYKGDTVSHRVTYDRVLVREGKVLRAVRPRELRCLWSEWATTLQERKAANKAATEAQAKSRKLQASQYRKIKQALKALGYKEHEDFHEASAYNHTTVSFSLEAMFCLLGIRELARENSNTTNTEKT